MADEYYNNKIVTTDGDVLMDLTQDTATPETVLEGETFHLRSGAPAVGTYRPSAEIEARLEATVGHSSKNLLDISGQDSTNYGVRWYEDNGRLRAVGTYNDNAAHSQPRFYVKLKAGSYILSGSPIYSETGVRILIGTCLDAQGTSFTALGYDEGNGFTFTLQSDTWVSIRMYTAKNVYQQSIDLTLPVMIRSGSISDDTFEPYVTPTDEKKQDKPVVLWEAALNSTGVSEVAISNLADNLSNYSYLKVVVTNELGTTITDQTVVQTDVEYDLSYIGQDVVRSTGGMLGFHEVNGKLAFDRLFIWVLSDGTNIIVIGLRDHDDSIGPPDTVPGLFIRRIIGIPK